MSRAARRAIAAPVDRVGAVADAVRLGLTWPGVTNPQGWSDQSLISQMTAPLVTVAPTSACRPVTVPALWA